MVCLPKKCHYYAAAPSHHQSLHQLRGQLETKIEFLRPVSPFFSRAGGKKDLSVHCDPSPAGEDIPPPTACQPQRLPEGPGNLVDANKRTPPTKLFHLTLFLRIDLVLPTSNSPQPLWISITFHKTSKAVCLNRNSGFDFLWIVGFYFFPPQNKVFFCSKRIKHDDRSMLELFCTNPIYCTQCNCDEL